MAIPNIAQKIHLIRIRNSAERTSTENEKEQKLLRCSKSECRSEMPSKSLTEFRIGILLAVNIDRSVRKIKNLKADF
jgi:ribosomal protein L21E